MKTGMTVSTDRQISRICITDYDHKRMQGTLYNVYLGHEVEFYSLTELILLIDDMLREQGSPQNSVEFRQFTGAYQAVQLAPELQERPPDTEHRSLATFNVRVIFRQGASWQGKVTWIEGKEEVSFRSVLELIKLMDSVLPQAQRAADSGVQELVV